MKINFTFFSLKINSLFKENSIFRENLLLFTTICISIFATVYFYYHGNQNLSNYDAIARLNLARKIIDSITPGVGQLGGIWLPLPQVLFVPFIWNDFLWHSGFAGYFVSGAAFILSAIFLQKTALLITKNIKASLLVWFLFVTNQNILLFQSMAMSESFFFFGLIMSIYFLTKWAKTHEVAHLLSAAFFIMLVTLTRYEGYFIFIGSLAVVFIELVILYLKKDGWVKIEGMILVFLTISGYGIFLWCLYCTIFFKDPLYWLHLYSLEGGITPQATTSVNTSNIGILESFNTYFIVSFWMIGLINFMLGIVSFAVFTLMFIKKIRRKENIQIYLTLFIISIVLFFFLVYGYYKGLTPPITFPSFSLPNLLNKNLSVYTDVTSPNIRYGLTVAPIIFLFIGFFASKERVFFVVSLFLIIFQLFTNFYTPYFLQFSLPQASKYVTLPSAAWFRTHYDKGLILISANEYENFMFESKLSYNHFIYEGTRQYWKTSINNPAKYASWVVYNDTIFGDKVNTLLTQNAHNILDTKFELVYNRNGFKIYHIISQ